MLSTPPPQLHVSCPCCAFASMSGAPINGVHPVLEWCPPSPLHTSCSCCRLASVPVDHVLVRDRCLPPPSLSNLPPPSPPPPSPPLPSPPPPSPSPPSSPPPSPPPLGTVAGYVVYIGNSNVNLNGLIRFDADPFCSAYHGNTEVRSEKLLIDANSRVENVVVSLVNVNNVPWPSTPPPSQQTLQMVGCMYEPRIMAMQVNQGLRIENADQTVHTPRIFDNNGNVFGPLGMPKNVPDQIWPGGNTTGAYAAKCDIHPWMKAKFFVFDHPYFAITASDGTFQIPDVPHGTYQIAFSHEICVGLFCGDVLTGSDRDALWISGSPSVTVPQTTSLHEIAIERNRNK